MPARFHTASADFASQLRTFLQARDAGGKQVSETVAAILADVKSAGDAALLSYTARYDRHETTAENLRVTPQETAQALSLCTPELIRSLKLAGARIRDYSLRQLPQDLDYTDGLGVRLGHRWSPVESVGLYVPGGLASYPSSVLMNAVPALTAGVRRLAMVVPAPEGRLNPALLAAAHVAGVTEIYRIGGAQAVAALAFGTQTIPPVDKIVGPGNAYVAEAKRQVFGRVGIDMIAGPSEILVIADSRNDPAWIAADLLSQSEHDPLAQSVLITDDEGFADRVESEIARILTTMDNLIERTEALIAKVQAVKQGLLHGVCMTVTGSTL
jgi:histidinol dehydrogenase